MERIVVGFDGTDASVAALRWADAEAALRDATVEGWTVAGQHERMPAPASSRETWVVKGRDTLAGMVESAAGGVASHHWKPGCGEPVVVAGIDGTPQAQAVLATGAAEARLRGACLQVVHAVHWAHGAYSLCTPSRAELLGWVRTSSAGSSSGPGSTCRYGPRCSQAGRPTYWSGTV